MLGSNLLRFNKNQKFLLPDFETEGLNLRHSKPWQLSFLTFDLYNNYEEFDFYIKWDDLNISREAAAATGFNLLEYKQRAKDPREVLEEFESFLTNKEYRVVWHNGLGFDSMIHNVLRQQLGLKSNYDYLYDREFSCYDTLALSKAFKLGIPPDISSSNAFLAWQYRVLGIRTERSVKTNLGAMGKEFNIDFNQDDLHDALFDIRLNREIFRKLIFSLDI